MGHLHTQQYTNIRNHTLRKRVKFFKKKQIGNKKTLPWKIGDVVTVASAVPQPNGRDPERRSTPPGGTDAPLLMRIQVPTRRANTRINKRRTNPQEEDHLFSPFPKPTGIWLDQTLHTSWENTTHHACEWTGTQCVV